MVKRSQEGYQEHNSVLPVPVIHISEMKISHQCSAIVAAETIVVYHRITEYSELERTHKDHQVQHLEIAPKETKLATLVLLKPRSNQLS